MTIIGHTSHVARDDLIAQWSNNLRGHGMTIALPDGADPRALHAASHLHQAGIVKPRLFGDTDTIRNAAATHGLDLPSETIVDLHDAATEPAIQTALTTGFVNHPDQRDAAMEDPLYIAAAALRAGQVDSCVAGATCPTADVLRAGLRVIGLTPGVRTLSSCFLMLLDDGRRLTFSDCAVVPDPSADQLTDIAVAASHTHQALAGDDPVVAMLSFSTQYSAEHPRIDIVREAAHNTRQHEPQLCIDGELQLDAALVESVAATKAPASRVAGQANVLVFPNLDAGNIGYKLAERLGNALALGPILQGLAAPINDLSRGCSAHDMEVMALLSGVQAVS